MLPVQLSILAAALAISHVSNTIMINEESEQHVTSAPQIIITGYQKFDLSGQSTNNFTQKVFSILGELGYATCAERKESKFAIFCLQITSETRTLITYDRDSNTLTIMEELVSENGHSQRDLPSLFRKKMTLIFHKLQSSFGPHNVIPTPNIDIDRLIEPKSNI